MATDATGTPTPLGIPTYDTAVDAPSGNGNNAQMQAIDALLAARVVKPSGMLANEVPVWNGSAWVRSSQSQLNAQTLLASTTGATASARFVGGTVSGAPTSGTFSTGDFVVDQSGSIWVCTVAGSPGTWKQAGGGSVTSAMAKIKQTAAQSIPSRTWTKLTGLSTIDIDTDSMTGTADQLTIQHAGKYEFIATYGDGTTNSIDLVRIKLNGTEIARAGGVTGTSGVSDFLGPVAVTIANCNAGDVITVEAYQGDTVAHNTSAGISALSAVKVDGAMITYVQTPANFVGQEIDYAAITTSYSVVVASGVFGAAIIQGNSQTYDGSTRVRIEVFLPGYYSGGSTQRISLFRDSSEIAIVAGPSTAISANPVPNGNFVLYETPANGSHAYSIKGFGDGANAIKVNAGAGGANTLPPAYIRVTRAA